MHNSKFIRHLSQFDKNEWKQFGHFLASPFFFKGKVENKLISLYKYLDRFYPKFEHKKFTASAAFSLLYPNRKFNAPAFQQLTTKFNKAIEHFIELTYSKKIFGFPKAGMGLVNFYEEKKMFTYFEKAHQKVSKHLATQRIKNPEDFWSDFIQAMQLTFHQGNLNLRHTDLNLPETLLSLDYFYLVLKLQLACAFENQNTHQHPTDAQGGLVSFNAIFPLLKKGAYREAPLIDLLFRTYLLLQKQSTHHEFQDLKTIFTKHAMELDLTQRQIIHNALRNFCSREINAGKEAYLLELMKLYEEGLPLQVLYSDGKLSGPTFQNMVTVGLRLNNFKWVENFLEEHRHRIISKEEPESYYTLAKASLLVKQKKFDAALEYLTYSFSDTYSKLIARRLEVQIYYELKSTILASKIQAFKVFVFRTSKAHLTEIQKEGYSNFIDILKQIIHPSTRYNHKRIDTLLQKLRQKKTVAGKNWLMDKLEELR